MSTVVDASHAGAVAQYSYLKLDNMLCGRREAVGVQVEAEVALSILGDKLPLKSWDYRIGRSAKVCRRFRRCEEKAEQPLNYA